MNRPTPKCSRWISWLRRGRLRRVCLAGRSNYLTKQTGEYLVAAELSRRGFIATTFTGNVPSYDIDGRGGHALVQVKAISAASWQLNVGQFADVVFDGPKQIIQAHWNVGYSAHLAKWK